MTKFDYRCECGGTMRGETDGPTAPLWEMFLSVHSGDGHKVSASKGSITIMTLEDACAEKLGLDAPEDWLPETWWPAAISNIGETRP